MRGERQRKMKNRGITSPARGSEAAGCPFVAAALFFLLLLSSCGYHISGTGGIVPEGSKTIAVPVFFNATNEPSVDVEVTQAVVDEFMTDGRLKVVSPEEADLALHGRIVLYEVNPLSYTAQSFVQQYGIHLVVDASLEDLRSKKVLWTGKGIESKFISNYTVSYDAVGQLDLRGTRVAKEAALKSACKDIAGTLRSSVLEGF